MAPGCMVVVALAVAHAETKSRASNLHAAGECTAWDEAAVAAKADKRWVQRREHQEQQQRRWQNPYIQDDDQASCMAGSQQLPLQDLLVETGGNDPPNFISCKVNNNEKRDEDFSFLPSFHRKRTFQSLGLSLHSDRPMYQVANIRKIIKRMNIKVSSR